MSFLRKLWDALFGDDSPKQATASPEPAGGGGVALLDPPPASAAQAGACPSDADGGHTSRFWWLPQDVKRETDEVPENLDRMSDELYHTLAKLVDSPSVELPRLPQNTERALAMLRDSNVNYHKLARVVEEDPTLTADVLRVANSVMFRGFSEITQLEPAFARLGQRNIRGILLNATMRHISIRLGSAKRSLGEGIWRRAVASGVIMNTLARRCGVDPDEAFLVGLLHDIGLLVVLSVTHGYELKHRQRVPRDVFDRLATEWHEHAGLRLANSWNLPEPLPPLIASHHRLPAEGDAHERLRLLILTSDAMCALLRFAPYHPYNLFEMPSMQRLGLRDDAKTRELLLSIPDAIGERLAGY